jgi:nucleolar GTP-binding protein
VSDDDDYMDIDQVQGRERTTSAKGKKERSLTPAQLKSRAHSKIRSLSKGRREGNEPPRLPYKIEPAEHIRLAKKINKRFKHSL